MSDRWSVVDIGRRTKPEGRASFVRVLAPLQETVMASTLPIVSIVVPFFGLTKYIIRIL